MVGPNSPFSLSEQAEVFLSKAATSRAVGKAVRAGRARKLGPRLYTKNIEAPAEQIARRNWQRIAGLYFPGAVVVDRSAFEAKPSTDGSLFLDAGPDHVRREAVRLPGLTLRPRRGPGPVAGDIPYMDGLYFSGPARKFVDNMRPSRAARGRLSRTLSGSEVEAELIDVTAKRGSESLNELRDGARTVAQLLDAEAESAGLEELIGAVLGTRESPLETDAPRAQSGGLGFDPRRIELFEALQALLLTDPLPSRVERPDSHPTLSFFEAYFSNYIEGTEFELAEAEEIVFEGAIPPERMEDAHDVLGTFEVVDGKEERARVPTGPADLLDLLRSRHARMLARRPAADPGAFKQRANQAGGTSFVRPELVEGTLYEGYRYYEPIPSGLPKAIFLMFLISEVHPFTDGNGRVGRVFMNAELSAVDGQRIVIPICFRENYLQGLRALSLNANPRPLVKVLDFAQRYAAAIDWSELRRAEAELRQTNAFVTPERADQERLRLRLPEGAGP